MRARIRVLLFLAVAACDSCDKTEAPVDKFSPVTVVGSPEHDFGVVDRDENLLIHEFSLHNAAERRVLLQEIRKSCGCLGAEAASMEIGPGETVVIKAVLDTRMVSGKRSAVILVLFTDEDLSPISLSLKAFVEAPYRVTVSPLIWAVPAVSETATSIVQRTFSVNEFMSTEIDATAVTEVTSSSPLLTVGELQSWTVRGWRGPGFARDATLLLTLEPPPEGFGSEDHVVQLLFRHGTDREERLRFETVVDLRIRRM